jgi:hypothetical protein
MKTCMGVRKTDMVTKQFQQLHILLKGSLVSTRTSHCALFTILPIIPNIVLVEEE